MNHDEQIVGVVQDNSVSVGSMKSFYVSAGCSATWRGAVYVHRGGKLVNSACLVGCRNACAIHYFSVGCQGIGQGGRACIARTSSIGCRGSCMLHSRDLDYLWYGRRGIWQHGF